MRLVIDGLNRLTIRAAFVVLWEVKSFLLSASRDYRICENVGGRWSG